MTHKLRFSAWFSIILLSAFLVGYLSWSKATFNWPFDGTFYPYPEKHKNNAPQPPLSLRGGEGELDLTGWKTYRNEGYGFEFKYPENLNEYRTKNEIRLANFNWEPMQFRDFYHNEIFIFAYASDVRQYQYIVDNFNKMKKNFVLGGESAVKSVNVGYQDGFFGEGPPPSKTGDISVEIVRNGIQYGITVKPFNVDNEKLFKQILSTFKFITP